MKLVSFSLASPMGPQQRTGALNGRGQVVDLAAAYRLLLLEDGLTGTAAARISAALLPGDMVALIEGGPRSLDAARDALDWAAAHDMDGRRRAGDRQRAGGVPARIVEHAATRSPAAAAARFHGLRAAPAQHFSKAWPRDPAGVVQAAGILQGQSRQPGDARRPDRDPELRRAARHRVRAGAGDRARRDQYPGASRRSSTCSAT